MIFSRHSKSNHNHQYFNLSDYANLLQLRSAHMRVMDWLPLIQNVDPSRDNCLQNLRVSKMRKDASMQLSSSSSSGSLCPDQQYFTANNHAQSNLKRMESYFLRSQLCDVNLMAGGRKIPAHRLVLSSCSDYFAAMFTSDVKEATAEEVEMKDVNSDALWSLVHYCYTGQLELREDNVELLLSTAALLQLSQVVDACCMFLVRQLHPSNCLGIRQFADSQGCMDLMKTAHEYTMEHFLEVMFNQEFVMLPSVELAKLLSYEELNVPCEETIFNALVTWLKHDPTRETEVGPLLALVKLPLLTPQFLTDHIETNPVFQNSNETQQLIVEALKYHLLPERRMELHSPRTTPRKSTVGKLFVVGGMDMSKGASVIERYDLRTDKWEVEANMNVRRLQFGVAVLDDKLCIVGGRDGLKTLNTVECYDPRLKLWSLMPPMSTHRHGLGVAVLEGPMYAVGGHDGWSFLNTVERWDPQARQWSYVANMSTARNTAGVAVLGGRLYAVGGRDGSACLNSVECFDPHTNKWTPCQPMACRRSSVAVGVAAGYMYAFGGHNAPSANPCAARMDSVERYDPKCDQWTFVCSMSIGRDAIGVCVLGEQLLAIGGYDGQQYLETVEAYDPYSNEWTAIAPLSKGRAGAGGAVIKHI